MQFFFVGLAMRSHGHDYAPVHAALFAMRARRVSLRIWLCAVTQEATDVAFAQIGRCLDVEDEMLIVEVPEQFRSPRLVSAA